MLAYERMTLEPCGPIYIMVVDGGNIEKVDVNHEHDPRKCPSIGGNIPLFGRVYLLKFSPGPAKGNFYWEITYIIL